MYQEFCVLWKPTHSKSVKSFRTSKEWKVRVTESISVCTCLLLPSLDSGGTLNHPPEFFSGLTISPFLWTYGLSAWPTTKTSTPTLLTRKEGCSSPLEWTPIFIVLASDCAAGIKGFEHVVLDYIPVRRWWHSDELDTQADGYANPWSGTETESFFVLLSKFYYVLGMKGVGYIFLNCGVYFSKYGLIDQITWLRMPLKESLSFPNVNLKGSEKFIY